MKGVNKCIIVGTLGKDPELKFTPNGVAVLNMSVATSESWKDKNTGQQSESTEWHRIVMFNKAAEIAGEYLHKGSKVYLEGKLKTRSWEQDGVKRYATEIVCNEFQFLDSKGQGQQQAPMQQPPQQRQAPQQQQQVQQNNAPQPQGQPQQLPPIDNFDDSIPF